MHCVKCGAEIPQNASVCSSCGASVSPKASGVAVDKVKTASSDAFRAFRMFVSNPVAGLAGACETIGETRTFGVGITFGALFTVCVLFAVYRLLPAEIRPAGFTGFIKILMVAVVPFVTLFGASFIAVKACRGQGTWGDDGFIAGASLLPAGFLALLAGILGFGNMEVIAVVAVFAVCLTILMLFAGLTRISKISERLATIAVPLILIVSAWLCKVIYAAMLQNSGAFG